MISILHPSRQRPGKSRATILKWIDRAVHKDQLEINVSLDSDDPLLSAYLIQGPTGAKTKTHVNENRSAIDAINHAAKLATGDIFIVVSDDTDCPDGWDEKLLASVAGKTDWILKCSDGGTQNWIITMPVMDRTYYNRFGYVYFPDYMHMFCDTDLTAVADLMGRLIYSDICFNHDHYSKSPDRAKDAVSEKADSTWDQGKTLFLNRVKNNFGLVDPPGGITDPTYLAWIQREMKNQ
jgi:glycosyltransferase involved in cell wall biosynthesis